MGVVECKGKCMTKVGVQRFDSVAVCVCVCVRVRVRVRARARACVFACVFASVRARMCVYTYIRARENARAFDDVLKTFFSPSVIPMTC